MALERWRERAEAPEAEVYALHLALRDRRTPLVAKAVIVLVVAYVASPVDPIPDVIPVVGYLDELVVVPVGVALARRSIPAEVMEECRERAGGEVAVGRVRWLGAGIVVLLWLLVVVAAVLAVTDWA